MLAPCGGACATLFPLYDESNAVFLAEGVGDGGVAV